MANPSTNEQSVSASTGDEAEDAQVSDTNPVAASSSIGTLLCATRMRMGRDLQLVAEVLHIRYNYLVAIEDGRYEDLPGQAYAVGFVRSYADHLGLDGTEVVRRYKEESAGVRRKATFEFPIPTPDSGVPSGTLLLLAVVFGMIVYGVWYSIVRSDRNAVQLIQEVPSRLAALLGDEGEAFLTEESGSASQVGVTPGGSESGVSNSMAPVLPGAETQVAAVPSPQGVGLASESPVSDDNAENVDTESAQEGRSSDEAPPTTQVAEQSNAEGEAALIEESPPESAADDSSDSIAAGSNDEQEASSDANTDAGTEFSNETTQSAGAPTSVARETADMSPSETEPQQAVNADEVGSPNVVELRAKADSWIQLRDGEELLLTRLLRKGETFRVPERGGLTLMTGNAGGLDVLVNGELMPPLGVEGTVARGVPLDPQLLQAGGG